MNAQVSVPSKEDSEETAIEIDHEVSQLMSQGHDRVKVILTEKREQFETISQALMEKETILADELYGLLHGKKAEARESAGVKSQRLPFLEHA